MKADVMIDIGSKFSRYPAGRFPADGKFNGETFREKFLKLPLLDNKVVEITLDSALSYGSSFLEEAFGGLVRSYDLTLEFLHKHIILVSSDPFLKDEIWSYVDDAFATKNPV